MFTPMFHGQNRNRFDGIYCPEEYVLHLISKNIVVDPGTEDIVSYLNQSNPTTGVTSSQSIIETNGSVGGGPYKYSEKPKAIFLDSSFNNEASSSFTGGTNKFDRTAKLRGYTYPYGISDSPCSSALYRSFTAFIVIKYNTSNLTDINGVDKVLFSFGNRKHVDLGDSPEEGWEQGDITGTEWCMSSDKIYLQFTGRAKVDISGQYYVTVQIDSGGPIGECGHLNTGDNKVILAFTGRKMYINGELKINSPTAWDENTSWRGDHAASDDMDKGCNFFRSGYVNEYDDGHQIDNPNRDSLWDFSYPEIQMYPREFSEADIKKVTNQLNFKYNIY